MRVDQCFSDCDKETGYDYSPQKLKNDRLNIFNDLLIDQAFSDKDLNDRQVYDESDEDSCGNPVMMNFINCNSSEDKDSCRNPFLDLDQTVCDKDFLAPFMKKIGDNSTQASASSKNGGSQLYKK